MEEIKFIRINKNRGWRGLAELYCMDKDRDKVTSNVFSFSQDAWEDMLLGKIVIQDKDNYYVIHFGNLDKLPKPTQQRSVLITNFEAVVKEVNSYSKTDWIVTTTKDDTLDDYNAILHFIRNRNNHTTSDWNCIGIRVIPTI